MDKQHAFTVKIPAEFSAGQTFIEKTVYFKSIAPVPRENALLC